MTFSLSTELEIEVAERIAELDPCAEPVRFGKNGSDATAAVAPLTRACKGRERIAICGLFARGFLFLGTHRARAQVDALLARYRTILPRIAGHLRKGSLRDVRRAEPLEPLFGIR